MAAKPINVYISLLKQQNQGQIPLVSDKKELLENDAMHNKYALGNMLDDLKKKL